MEIPKHPQAYDKFINDVLSTAEDNGITIRTTTEELVFSDPQDTVGCAGYFSSELKELAFSTYDKDINRWMGLLIHESCHMDQFLYDKPLWNKCIYGLDYFFQYLTHSMELSPAQLKKYTDQVIELELDCEKRSVAKIKKYHLPVDIQVYKRKSNTYFYGILYCSIKRQWFNRIYSKKDIWSKAPDRFQSQYNTIPPALLQAFEKHIN